MNRKAMNRLFPTSQYSFSAMNDLLKKLRRLNQLLLWTSITLLLLGVAEVARAQGTAFTYNGRLTENGAPVNGAYDMRFTLYDANAGDVVIAGPLPISPVDVVNGLFTVRIDFGAGVFTGPSRWLNVEVQSVGGGGFALLTPRQEVTSSPYTIRAQTAGSVADSSVVANQLNTGGVPPTPGQFLSYNGGNLFWTDPGAAAGNVWSRNGADAYYTAGSVGIGTANPTPGVRLEVGGNARVVTGGSGGYVQIGTPGGETGLGVIGVNRFDLRFDGATLKLAAGAGVGPPPAQYGITINTNGNIGVGMASPLVASQWKLEVAGPTRIVGGGSGGAVQFSAPNGESGLGILGANRTDFRFDGSSLKIVAGVGSGPPPAENGLVVTTAGNVGIGTATPIAKLDVENAQSGKSAVFGNETGTSGVGVYGGATAPSGVGVFARNLSGVAIYADGNAAQARDKGGVVKAMVYVDANGTITRCYNGLTGASGGACGFTIEKLDFTGLWRIDFGFRVDDRFASVTPGLAEQYHADGNYTEYKGPTGASILYGYQPTFIGESHPNSLFVQQSLPAKFESPYFYWAGFTLIVY